MAAAISANRPRTSGRTVTILSIVDSNNVRADRHSCAKKNPTKVRRVERTTTSTSAASLLADDEVGLRPCEEHAAAADLSDGKHEDFGRSAGTQSSRHSLRQIALTIFLEIFGEACT